MKKLRLFGVFCACVFPFVFGNISHAATVQYSYTGNPLVSSRTNPLCTIGTEGCFNNITATVDLSGILGNSLALQTITPLAWSISDGLTTINSLSTDVTLFEPIKISTDGTGNIIEWRFIVQRLAGTNQPVDELVYMQTINDSGANDTTAYCRIPSTPDGTSCRDAEAATVADAGAWTMAAVPLPATVWLFGSGLLGLVGVARRRRSA